MFIKILEKVEALANTYIKDNDDRESFLQGLRELDNEEEKRICVALSNTQKEIDVFKKTDAYGYISECKDCSKRGFECMRYDFIQIDFFHSVKFCPLLEKAIHKFNEVKK